MSFRIRQAESNDHARILPLFEAFYREIGVPEAIEVLPETLSGVLDRSDTNAFVAETANEVIGAAALSTAFGLESGLYCELEDLFVLRDWRGHGVASALVDAAVAWAGALGCRDMDVVLTPKSRCDDALVSWYAKRQYEPTGRTILTRELIH